MPALEQAANAAYTAYCAAVGGVAFNGDVLPDWATQCQRNPKIAEAWRKAAAAAYTEFMRD